MEDKDMKFLDKLALKIFSIIILVVSIIAILVVTEVVSMDSITDFIANFTDGVDMVRVTIIAAVVLLILAIKGLFFTSKPKNEGKNGIVLENQSGKLVISKESLDNLIASVVKEIPGAESISSRTFLDKNKNLIVYVTTILSKDVMIKDVSAELQEKIKEALKRTADLEVKEVNIKVKNVVNKRVKGLPESKEEKPEEKVEEEPQAEEENTDNNEEKGE
jgi:uncharacterized alkaline shock family protein YloU